MTSIRYSLPLSRQQQEQQQKEDTRSKVVFKDTGHQTMKDTGLEIMKPGYESVEQFSSFMTLTTQLDNYELQFPSYGKSK